MTFAITPDGVRKSDLAAAVAGALCTSGLSDDHILATSVSVAIMVFDEVIDQDGLPDAGAQEQLFRATLAILPGLVAKALASGGAITDLNTFAETAVAKAHAICSAIGY